MIASIRHKGLAAFFRSGDHRGIPAKLAMRIARLLDMLDASVGPRDMDLPGYKFHQLKGRRAGTYAVSVSANLRLTFRFDAEDAIEVDLEDYH
jgi:proteic killer suppression protein